MRTSSATSNVNRSPGARPCPAARSWARGRYRSGGVPVRCTGTLRILPGIPLCGIPVVERRRISHSWGSDGPRRSTEHAVAPLTQSRAALLVARRQWIAVIRAECAIGRPRRLWGHRQCREREQHLVILHACGNEIRPRLLGCDADLDSRAPQPLVHGVKLRPSHAHRSARIGMIVVGNLKKVGNTPEREHSCPQRHPFLRRGATAKYRADERHRVEHRTRRGHPRSLRLWRAEKDERGK